VTAPAHDGPRDDPFDLARFVAAQDDVYGTALAELRAGRKRSHWMWFVFPQVAGLGRSSTARYYAVRGLPEARALLAHPVLGPRLREAAAVARDAPAASAEELFGGIDAVKARSSMTLAARAADDPEPFRAVLDRWFDGTEDPETVRLLGLA
jgi:uncharacterized protein (DUF1810 family)